MKSKFIMISRIVLGLFILLIAILVGFVLIVKQEVINLPTILGILLLVTGIATMVCIAIAFTLAWCH